MLPTEPARAADRGDGELLDLGGRFLLPGLISCHTHLSVVFPFDDTDEHESAGLTTTRAAARARDALLSGITTIRCVHEQNRADLLLRQSASRGWVQVPRIFGAGQALSTTGGHGWGSGCSYADGPDSFLAAARAELAAGADHIKVFITGGHRSTPPRALTVHAGHRRRGACGAVRAASERAKPTWSAHAANSAEAIRQAHAGRSRGRSSTPTELDDQTARADRRAGRLPHPDALRHPDRRTGCATHALHPRPGRARPWPTGPQHLGQHHAAPSTRGRHARERHRLHRQGEPADGASRRGARDGVHGRGRP